MRHVWRDCPVPPRSGQELDGRVTTLLDAHVHAWDPGRLAYPWLAAHPPLLRRFVPGDLRAAVPLAGRVLVEADCRPDQAEAETAWLLDLARADPRTLGVVAAVRLERGAAVRPRLEELAAEPLVVGVRRLLQDEPAGLADSPEFVEGTRLLADAGLASDLCVRSWQLPEVTRLVRLCPEVTFVLDHLGKPAVTAAGPTAPWTDDLARLAALRNVVVKLSGLATEAPAGTPPEHHLPYLRHAIDCFTPARCLFGGDWPVSTLATTYRTWYDTVASAVADLAPAERAGILAGTARRVYALPAPEEDPETIPETTC
jgi:L-fuconolactonase